NRVERRAQVAARRAEVRDRGAQGEATAQARVRHVGRAAALDALHDARVQPVEPGVDALALVFTSRCFKLAAGARGRVAEAADAERDRGHRLEVVRVADESGQVFGERAVLRD